MSKDLPQPDLYERVPADASASFTNRGPGTGKATPLPAAFGILMVFIVTAIAGALVLGTGEAGSFVLILVLSLPIAWIARTLPRSIDRRWLPTLIVTGWAVKLFGSSARYWVLQTLYRGVADATGYHGAGVRNALIWRSIELPRLGTGTHFVDAATGFLYIPYTPTLLGGFYLFATLAFFGQLLLYAAFRRALPDSGLKWFAALVFFYPNIVYWPSSIGKEALMLLFIGIATYGAVRIFADYGLLWVLVMAIGVTGAGLVRSHIALLLVVSVTAGMLLGKKPSLESARLRRIVTLSALGLVLVGAVNYAIQDFGIDLSAGISESLLEEEFDPIFAGVEASTEQGGSAVDGQGIRSPLDIPEAVIRVVFRPLPPDAHNIQALLNSLAEGSLLLALFIWRSPAILRNFHRRWREPFVVMSLVYCAGFIFGHSPVLNLAIMARQRAQVIAFVLALLVVLGERPKETTKAPEADPLYAAVGLPG